MKLSFIGAGGVRTPLVIQSVLSFQDKLPLDEVCMMDIDAERLELMKMACKPRLAKGAKFKIEWTTDARKAIQGADFIVTTFREGSIESRVIDEQVPLKYGVLGQETTGPGGFAMALRTIPVILKYVEMIRKLAPDAWLLNFSNPAGILAEAITRAAGFEKAVGICDNPSGMLRAAAAFKQVDPDALFPDYYGLNHLGWMRGLYLNGKNLVPEYIQTMKATGEKAEHLPFEIGEIVNLGAIPNEYNYFYSSPRTTVENLLKAGQSRAQQILPLNQELYASLKRIKDEEEDPQKVQEIYLRYLDKREGTYMTLETGRKPEEAVSALESKQEELGTKEMMDESAEGYSAVALNVIQGLIGDPRIMILNVPNRGAITGMAEDDVVETTCLVANGVIRPFAVGSIPDANLGLMKSVKAYERLTIQAAVEDSYNTALEALTLHPLVPGYEIAKSILDDYLDQHGDCFPKLKNDRV
jgi:6-phospho-beta-glucosidase